MSGEACRVSGNDGGSAVAPSGGVLAVVLVCVQGSVTSVATILVFGGAWSEGEPVGLELLVGCVHPRLTAVLLSRPGLRCAAVRSE